MSRIIHLAAEVKFVSDQREGDYWSAELTSDLRDPAIQQWHRVGTGKTPQGAVEALKARLKEAYSYRPRVITFDLEVPSDES